MSEHGRQFFAAVGGTLATVGLSHLSEIATIVAGFGTAIYGVSWAALAWIKHFSKPKPEPEK